MLENVCNNISVLCVCVYVCLFIFCNVFIFWHGKTPVNVLNGFVRLVFYAFVTNWRIVNKLTKCFFRFFIVHCRGEKLYVTKDKRSGKSWKRCICWTVGLGVLGVIILVAILAGSKCTILLFISGLFKFAECSGVIFDLYSPLVIILSMAWFIWLFIVPTRVRVLN